jgi:hypothetical protein
MASPWQRAISVDPIHEAVGRGGIAASAGYSRDSALAQSVSGLFKTD